MSGLEFDKGEKFQSEIRTKDNEDLSGDKSGDYTAEALHQGEGVNNSQENTLPEPKTLKVIHIPPVDRDDELTRKNIALEKSQPNQRIEWASPKKRHHEKQIEKKNLQGDSYLLPEIKDVDLLPPSKIKKTNPKKKERSTTPRRSTSNSRAQHARSQSPHLARDGRNYFSGNTISQSRS